MNSTLAARSRSRRSMPMTALIAVAAFSSLTVAAWAGLGRLGVLSGAPGTALHGPLMVLGFLGTVISVERAVGLGRGWGWISPTTAAVGAFAFLGGLETAGAIAFVISGIGMLAMYTEAARIAGPQAHILVMGLGAVGWVVTATAILGGAPIPNVVPAMATFLVLTICGERIELSRMGPHRGGLWIRWLTGAAVVITVGSGIATFGLNGGSRTAGAAMVILAVASAYGDIARRTIRMSGLPRFMAAALLAGYVWLAFSGLTWVTVGLVPGTPGYDMSLHTVFIGFVLSMIFAHAAVIVPAVTHIDLPYRRIWWIALGLLHASLLIRVIGDVGGWNGVRAWGGVFNVVALATFVLMAAGSALWESRTRRSVS